MIGVCFLFCTFCVSSNRMIFSEADPTSTVRTSITTQSMDKTPSDQVRAANVAGDSRPTRPDL